MDANDYLEQVDEYWDNDHHENLRRAKILMAQDAARRFEPPLPAVPREPLKGDWTNESSWRQIMIFRGVLDEKGERI